MVEIGAALTALRTAYDTAKAAKEVNDQASLNAAVSNIMERLTSAQFTLTEVLQEHHALLDENRRLREAQAKEARFDQYEPERSERGAFVLRLKPSSTEPDEILHAICPDCREGGVLSYLSEDEYGLSCFRCKYYASKKARPPRFKKRSRIVSPRMV